MEGGVVAPNVQPSISVVKCIYEALERLENKATKYTAHIKLY